MKIDLKTYKAVKNQVIKLGYGPEICNQMQVSFEKLTERGFLSEYAWVVLASGMKERVVRDKFPAFKAAFGGLVSALDIVENSLAYSERAEKVFGHKRKIGAIVNAAGIILMEPEGFQSFKEHIRSRGISALYSLPYIGPITSYHLAKNIGFPVAKPDRHLVRIAYIYGYKDVQKFCEDISEMSGDPVPVVDIVLWRFATLTDNYEDIFREAVNK